MIFSRTGGYMGMSFAIPIDVANDVREQLIKTGRVVRGRIGVAVQDVNAQLATSFGLDRPRGALVSAAEKDSPGREGRCESGRCDPRGERPRRSIASASFRTEVVEDEAGQQGGVACLARWQGAHDRRAKSTSSRSRSRFAPRPARAAGDETARLGIAVRPLTPEEKRQVETEGNLVVKEVSGPAAVAGVQPGDIILGVNGKSVTSVQQLRGAVKGQQSTVALLVERGNAQIFIPIRGG